MKKFIQCCMAVTMLVLPAVFSSAQAAEAVTERIYFVQQDGRHALVYTTSRTSYRDYNLWFNEKEGYQPEDYLKEFLYLFPAAGKWAKNPKPGYQVLKLPHGDFASLEWTDLEENGRLTVDSDGVYHYSNWDSETKTPAGHYGLWNSPGNFERIAYSWVFPDNLKPVTNTANQEGEWVQRHNTITYYGNNVNDLAFYIQYRPTTGSAYDDLKGLAGDGVDVEQEATGIKLTLAETLLFPTGVAVISSKGKEVLARLAETLKQRPSLHIVVSGHTDNVAIGGSLAKRFPTNWELSSIRSINVVHYLVDQGVAEPRFESHAFSFMKSKDTNDTEEGRANNRRIEIFLSER